MFAVMFQQFHYITVLSHVYTGAYRGPDRFVTVQSSVYLHGPDTARSDPVCRLELFHLPLLGASQVERTGLFVRVTRRGYNTHKG